MRNKVLLFRGGVDSVCSMWLLRPQILLYLDFQLSEQARELERLKTLKMPPGSRLIISDRFDLQDTRVENLHVPFRMMYLTLIALHYGPEIYFGTILSDKETEAQPRTRGSIESLVRSMCRVPAYAPKVVRNEEIDIQAPFRDLTKSRLVAAYLRQGFPAERLREARSCFSDREQECGICGRCVKKYIALVSNGISTDDLFKQDPACLVPSRLSMVRGSPLEEQEVLHAMSRLKAA